MTESQQVHARKGSTDIKAERDIFAGLAFCWGDMVLKLDSALTIRFARGATAHFTGLQPDRLAGWRLTDLVVPEDAEMLADLFAASRRHGRIRREPVRLVTHQGTQVPVRLAGYTNPDEPEAFYMALHMISAREKLATDQYRRDPVSGLLQTDAFAEVAAEQLRHGPADGRQVTVSLLELSDFERLAKSLSPARRAALTRRIAATITADAMDGAMAAHITEGRFGLVHQAGLDLAKLEQRIAEVTRRADPAGRGSGVDAASVTSDGADGFDEESIVQGVKYMLNQFGRQDRSRLGLTALARNMGELVDHAVREVSDFKQVVADMKFDMAFQPIVNATTGRVHHYEALCRFHGPGQDPAPGRRIAFAEETGMIHELDLAMARQVIAWLARRPGNDTATRVAVNVSGHSIETPAYTQNLLELLDARPWTQGRLLFEITESARMNDLRAANSFIRALRERGYMVCLDDLGAGAASFRYLSALEVDMVKIDGSAIHHAREGSKGRAFLSALTELCHRLDTATVAEMVDDEGGLKFVRDCGVTYAQGYLFGQPSADLRNFSPLRNVTLFQRHVEVA